VAGRSTESLGLVINTTVQTQWNQFRVRNRWAVWWFVLGLPTTIPAILGVGLVIEWLWPGYGVVALFLVPFAWAITWLWLSLRVTRLPCPRCGGLFHGHVLAHTMILRPRKCAQCGLRMYDEP
jgi:hypothetical protein